MRDGWEELVTWAKERGWSRGCGIPGVADGLRAVKGPPMINFNSGNNDITGAEGRERPLTRRDGGGL